MLLDDEHGRASIGGRAEGGEEPLHDHRGEAEREFVDEQQRGPSSQRSRQDQHLLFTPGQQPGWTVEESFELREELEGSVDPAGAEVEVDAGGQLAEDRTFFADEAEPAPARRWRGPVRGRPSKSIRPVEGSTPAMASIVVVLPAPLGPRSATSSPVGTWRSMPLTTGTSP